MKHFAFYECGLFCPFNGKGNKNDKSVSDGFLNSFMIMSFLSLVYLNRIIRVNFEIIK